MLNKHPISRHCSSQAGFSLLELMVTLVVAGIIAAIAIPNFMNWMPNIRLKSAARDLFSNMQNARMMAIKENRDIRIQFDNSISPGFYYFDLDEDGIPDPGEFRQDLAEYKSGVDFGCGNASDDVPENGSPPSDMITFSNDDDFVSFNSKGTGNAGYVYLEHEDRTTTYAVGARTSGLIKLARWTGSEWE